jgi:sortase A
MLSRRALSALLIAAGVLLFGAAVRHYARGAIAQREGRAAFEELATPAGRRPAGENPGIVGAASASSSSRETALRGRPLARLRIPAAKMDYVVFEGADGDTLEKGPGHVPGTALPGADGPPNNCVITAHRDSHFRRLGWLKTGHHVVLETPGALQEYRIVSRQIVRPDAVRVLAPTEKPRLTLITCYPFDFIGPAPKRLVLVAEPI